MKNSNGILIFNNAGLDIGLISALLEAEECTVFVTSLPLEALHILKTSNIDVVLASSHLEGMEGQEFKELADRIKPGVSIFLLPESLPMKIGETNGSSTQCVLNLKEFVNFLQNHLRAEKRLFDAATGFKEFFFSFTDKLLQIFEVNDKYFFNNNHLVADLAHSMAIKMGLDENLIDAIHLAALLRDIGKIGIQQEILNGKDRLGTDAFNQIKSHPLNTIQLLRQIKFPWNIESIVRHHHEHYDGKGYPDGLKGRYIPLGSRIISIADSYVAMTTERAYRKALTAAEARQEIMKSAGSQFDPEVVEAFFSVLQQQKFYGLVKKQILLLHQDRSVSAFIRLNIEDAEFDVFVANNIEEALDHMERITPALLVASQEALKTDSFNFYNEFRQKSPVPCIIIASQEVIAGQPPEGLKEYVSEPVDIDDLIARIRQAETKDTPKNEVMISEEVSRGISGALEEMGITDIIQLLNMGMKTAKIMLTNGKARAELYMKSGVIVYARLGDLTGNDAFFELIGWTKGEFRILHGQITDRVNITMETMTLLLEASRAMDEKKHAAEKGKRR